MLTWVAKQERKGALSFKGGWRLLCKKEYKTSLWAELWTPRRYAQVLPLTPGDAISLGNGVFAGIIKLQ